MGLTLAIDFGSTYTKAVAVDLADENLLGVAQAASTVDTDITLGLHEALQRLEKTVGVKNLNPERTLACSSAAGGLRLVAIGLVRVLTTKAAEEAALGAGAKLVGTFSYGLSPDDVRQIEQMKPDLMLLAGGTDGGNEETILQNAALLAACPIRTPVILAGNKMAAHRARSLLESGGKEVVVVANVLPELDKLNVEPTRAAIRETFMRRIVHAKGLDRAQDIVGNIIMPTPMAALEGARLLAEGAGEEEGLGELMIVDVGGATTDVHSVARGAPSHDDVIMKGLPEPYVKRTVEGDLGIRYNAESILEIAGKVRIEKGMLFSRDLLPKQTDLGTAVKYLSRNIGAVPGNEEEFAIDIGLASAAVDIATRRHAGVIEEAYFPTGRVRIQRGKDLTSTKRIIGTGGVFAYGREPRRVLEAASYDPKNPESLRPVAPEFFIDERYILFAVGLLAGDAPAEALRIMKKHLKRV